MKVNMEQHSGTPSAEQSSRSLDFCWADDLVLLSLIFLNVVWPQAI